MSALDSRCEKCERDIEQLRGELDALRLQMIDVVEGVPARVDEVLAKVEKEYRVNPSASHATPPAADQSRAPGFSRRRQADG